MNEKFDAENFKRAHAFSAVQEVIDRLDLHNPKHSKLGSVEEGTVSELGVYRVVVSIWARDLEIEEFGTGLFSLVVHFAFTPESLVDYSVTTAQLVGVDFLPLPEER